MDETEQRRATCSIHQLFAEPLSPLEQTLLTYRLQYFPLSGHPSVRGLSGGTTASTAQTRWMAMKELRLQFAQGLNRQLLDLSVNKKRSG